MKIAGLLICLFVISKSHSQTTLEKAYAADACNCIDSLKLSADVNQKDFAVCFQTALLKNHQLVLQESQRIYGDTSYESGFKLGTDLTKKTMIEMVGKCESYFHLMDSLRYEEYKTLDRDSLTIVLKEMNQAGVENQNETFLEKRALLSFHLKKYESALIDIEAVLQKNPGNGQAIFLKGWIYEINGDYDAAKIMYDKVADITKNSSFLIFSEVVKRKKKGKT